VAARNANGNYRDILHEFENFTGNFARAAVEAAVARREEVTPYLLRILEDTLDRAAQLDELTLADLRRDPTIYLLRPYDIEEEALSHLEEVCREIFEGQLDGWYRVPSSWPVNRDFDMFQRWFEYRFHSMLVDLCEDPLERDEL
jgi:hypothetical protein